MTTYRYDRAARRRPHFLARNFLARTKSLRPDRLVPNAKVSIPGRSSGVRLFIIVITKHRRVMDPQSPVRSRVRPAILTGGISMLSSMFRSDLPSVEFHDSAFSGGATVQR